MMKLLAALLLLAPLSARAHCHLQYQVVGPGGLFFQADLGPYQFLGVLPGGTTDQLGPAVTWNDIQLLEIYHAVQIKLTATDLTGSVTCPDVPLDLDGPPECTDDGVFGPPACTPTFTVTQTGPNAYSCASSCVAYPQAHSPVTNFYPGAAAAPPLTSLTPHTALAGASAQAVVLRGSGFVGPSQVRWNGTPLVTVLVDNTTLLALVPSAYLASGGANSVTVLNPGGESSALGFAVLTSSGSAAAPGASGVPSARAYPNPWKASSGASGVTFDTLPAGSTVKVFSVSGRLVKTLDAPAGTARWDLSSDGGGTAASGYYLYLITGPGGTQSGRLALIR